MRARRVTRLRQSSPSLASAAASPAVAGGRRVNDGRSGGAALVVPELAGNHRRGGRRDARRHATPGRSSPAGSRVSRWTTSRESPGTPAYSKPAGIARDSSRARARDVRALPRDVALVLHLGFEARAVERADVGPDLEREAVRPRRASRTSGRFSRCHAGDPHAVVEPRRSLRADRDSARAAPAAPRTRPSARRRPARSSRPRGVSRRSALSMRSSSRCSARDVNIRYGSRQPRVVRSSTRMPIYASSRPSRSAARGPARERRH